MQAERLTQLREAIAAIEHGKPRRAPASRCIDGLPVTPGLHEWFGLADARRAPRAPRTQRWIPPLGILLYLARRSLKNPGRGGCGGAGVVWIGRRCWPFFQGLPPDDRGVLLQRSIFIDPPDDMSRLWAIDLAARCPAVAAVVADGSRLDMAATRRVQLAAESGSALVLCARPPEEINHLSAARTRWLVRCAPSADKTPRTPRWNVELVRCKAMRPGSQWTVEWKSAQGGVVVHAVLADRPDPATLARAPVRRSA